MKPFKNLQRLPHFAAVQTVFDPPHIFFAEGGAPGCDQIQVAAAYGRMTGVKPRMGVFHAQDIDACRQQIVQSHPQGVTVHLADAFHVGDLA